MSLEQFCILNKIITAKITDPDADSAATASGGQPCVRNIRRESPALLTGIISAL